MENVWESAAIGGISGGFMGGAMAGPRHMTEASAAEASAAVNRILDLVSTPAEAKTRVPGAPTEAPQVPPGQGPIGVPIPGDTVVPVQKPGGYEGWTVDRIFGPDFGQGTTPIPMPPPDVFPSYVTPPPIEAPKPGEVPPEVVAFLTRMAPPLSPTPKSQMEAEMDPNLELKRVLDREVEMTSGVNVENLLDLVGPKLYGDPKDIVAVSIKEMLQNSHDAVKEAQEQGLPGAGNIDIKMDPVARTVTVYDDGIGMTPKVMVGQFLEIAGSEKGSQRPGGGFGMAKALFLYANGLIKVWGLRNGQISILETSGQELKKAAGNKALRKNIKAKVRSPTVRGIEDVSSREGNSRSGYGPDDL